MESNIFTNCFEDLASQLHKNTKKNCKEMTNVDVHQSLKNPTDLEKRRKLSIQNSIQNLSSSDAFESNLEIIPADDQCITPKSQNHGSPSDVRRWASVVKAKKKLLPSETSVLGTCVNDNEIRHETECVFKNFPESFKDHQGFISCNQNTFSCNVCNIQLDSVSTLSNHLKTRKHEDNIIECLKKKLDQTLYHVLDFVSFYGSNLCCNLCRCKIDLSSYNPYETVVNIIAHNTGSNHTNRNTYQETCNKAADLIRSLASNYSEIKENMCYIEKKMSPIYKCKLCEKNILYNENTNKFLQNLMCHLKSANHLNKRALETLKELWIFGKDYSSNHFSVINGNICCDHCNIFIETNVEKMISHLNGVEHSEHVLAKVNLTPSNMNCSEYKSIIEENPVSKVKSTKMETSVTEKEGNKNKSNNKKYKLRLSDLLKAHSDLSQINYFIENEERNVTCLICSEVVPLDVLSIRTHIIGSSHSKSDMGKKFEDGSPVSEDKVIIEGNKLDDLQKEFGYILDCKDETNTSQVTCLICQCTLNSSSEKIKEHLLSIQHQDKEIACLLRCPVCSRNVMSTKKMSGINILKSRKARCIERQKLPTSIQNKMYNWLLKRSPLVYENSQFLVTNIDGMHVYCKLCKALIQYSVYLITFENNVTRHLQGKVHITNLSKERNENTSHIEDLSSGAPTILLSPNNLQTKENEEVKEHGISIFKTEDKSYHLSLFTAIERNALISEPILPNPAKIKPLLYTTAKEVDSAVNQTDSVGCHLPLVENGNNTLKNDNAVGSLNINPSCESVASKPLSAAVKSCLLTFKEETSEEIIKRREKQISYGKNTLGYMRYCSKVPKSKRCPHHPETPPKHLKCSRRTWDEMIRVWRRKLHDWDPPTSTVDSLEMDIQPLPPINLK